MSTGCSIVMTTVASEVDADRLAATVLEEQLAACIQIYPVRSHYMWKGAVQNEREFLLQMKIRTVHYDELAARLRSVHPYETPEIIRTDIAAGDPAYLEWIAQVTRAE